MRAARILIASILLSGWSLPALAWGPNGHRIVGEIAENHLTDAARKGIAELVGRASLAQISTWADEIKSDPAWRHASPWHYINVPPGQTLDKARRSPRGDVVEAIKRFEGVLRDRGAGRKERVDALRFLVHLVGDVHQPLHAGYGSDRGGNDIRVRWFGESTDLHTVWDEHLVEHQRLELYRMGPVLRTRGTRRDRRVAPFHLRGLGAGVTGHAPGRLRLRQLPFRKNPLPGLCLYLQACRRGQTQAAAGRHSPERHVERYFRYALIPLVNPRTA